MDWLIKNGEWLFSGIAVAVPLALLGWIFSAVKRRRIRPDQAITAPAQVTVTSHNQSGGITAQTVNISAVSRQLAPEREDSHSLRAFAGTNAFIHTYSESREVANFALELVELLSRAGWNAGISVQHTGDASISDVIIEINSVSTGQEHARGAARKLQSILGAKTIASRIAELSPSSLPANSMYIRIGPIQ